MRTTRRSGSYRSRTRGYRQPSLYSRTEETKEPRNRRWPLFLLVIISLLGLAYLIFFSGVFAVNTVAFSPTRFIDRGELAKQLDQNRSFLDNNIITFGLFGLSGRLGQVTGVDGINIKRVSQHQILIEVAEKAPLLVWQSSNNKYLVDEDGIAWANYTNKYAALPLVVDTKNVPVMLSSRVVDANFVKFFKDVSGTFATTTGTKIVRYEVMDIISDLKITTDAGWYVYFDTNHTAKAELANLMRVIGQAQASKTKLEYVDLRIENRIFYK